MNKLFLAEPLVTAVLGVVLFAGVTMANDYDVVILKDGKIY